MASTAESALSRRKWVRRRRRLGLRLPWRWLKWAGLTLAVVMLLGGATLLVRHWLDAPRPGRARGELISSLQHYHVGNLSAARAGAAKAVYDKPDWGEAQALLARLDLAAGDGAAADAELDRAVASGFPQARTHHLRAEAQLLEGDPGRALSEAAQALPRYAGFAARVRAQAQAAQDDLPSARATMTAWLNANPEDAAGWATLADLCRQSGDIAGAIAAVDRALALNRHDADTLTLKGELIRGQYGLEAALPWFDAALKIDPGDADTLIAKAATLGDLGRYEDMLDATRRALASRPDEPRAYYLQAVLAARAGDDALARDLMHRTGGALDDTPGALLLNGVLAYRASADQQAADDWRQLIEQQPMNVTARRLLGAALLRLGDAAGALAVLKPIALRDDADSYTLTLVARAFEAEGKRDWAAKFIDGAARTAPGAPVPFGTDDDLSTLSAAADDSPDDPVAELGYIRGLVEAGSLASALAHAQALVHASPGAPAAQMILGDVLWTMKRSADAVMAYQRAANLRFDQPVMLRLVAGLDAIGRRPDAQRALALYLSQNPADISARRLAAHWQIAAHDWDAAIDTLEGLRATLGNNDAAILGELALAYAEDGDSVTARAYGAAAYRLAPMNSAVADAFGWALFKAGDRDGARQLLTEAASLAPADPQIAAHLARLAANVRLP